MHAHTVWKERAGEGHQEGSRNSWHLSALPLSLHQQMFMGWPGSWPSSWLLLKQSLKKVVSSKTGLGSPRHREERLPEKKQQGMGNVQGKGHRKHSRETGELRFRARKSQENSELGHLENVLHKNHHHQDHLNNWSHLYLRNSNIIITAFLIKKVFRFKKL